MPLEPIYSQQAAKMLDQIEQDSARGPLGDAICDVVDLVCDEPAGADARRQALRSPAGHTVWLVPVRSWHEDEDWVVLWQRRDNDALIIYVGPSSFK